MRGTDEVAELLLSVLHECAVSYFILCDDFLQNRYLGGEEVNLTLNVDVRFSATARRSVSPPAFNEMNATIILHKRVDCHIISGLRNV